jgi:predicted amino acid-binding ACT domain protein
VIVAAKIRRVDYFYASVKDRPGEAYALLSQLEKLGVNLMAFASVPVGPDHTQLTIFPEDTHILEHAAGDVGLEIDGPHPALMATGDDRLGAIATIHEKLADANVNVFASSGVTDSCGCYGYVIYVRPEDFPRAAEAVGA